MLKGNQGNLSDAVKEYWDVLDFNRPAKKVMRYSKRKNA
jgi:hypothetical protein